MGLDQAPTSVQPDPRGARLHPQNGGCFGDRQAIDGNELDELAVTTRELAQRVVDAPGLALGVETLLHSSECVTLESSPPEVALGQVSLSALSPELAGEDIASNASEPAAGA